MKKIVVKHLRKLSSFICCCLILNCVPMKAHAQATILQVKGDAVRVKLLDAFSAQAISNTDVEVQSNNAIVCRKAPCPANAKEWKGKSDASGYIVIPTSALQAVTIINTRTHFRYLIEASEKDASGSWVVELLPKDSHGANEPPRAFKLIDAQSSKPIVTTPLRIEFETEAGKRDSLTTATNALGWVFVPFEVGVLADITWVVVPGYRRTRVDFAWARLKKQLTLQKVKSKSRS